jgi:hypothetical protein
MPSDQSSFTKHHQLTFAASAARRSLHQPVEASNVGLRDRASETSTIGDRPGGSKIVTPVQKARPPKVSCFPANQSAYLTTTRADQFRTFPLLLSTRRWLHQSSLLYTAQTADSRQSLQLDYSIHLVSSGSFPIRAPPRHESSSSPMVATCSSPQRCRAVPTYMRHVHAGLCVAQPGNWALGGRHVGFGTGRHCSSGVSLDPAGPIGCAAPTGMTRRWRSREARDEACVSEAGGCLRALAVR